MSEENVKQIIEQGIKEALFTGIQAGKQENSGLFGDIKVTHREIMNGIESITQRLDKLNGSVAKHADKLNQMDIINAQVTLTQQQMVKDYNLLDKKVCTLSEKEEKSKEYKDQMTGSIGTWKWIAGFAGIGTLYTILKDIL